MFFYKEGETDEMKRKGEEKLTKKENEELMALRAEIQKNEERQLVHCFWLWVYKEKEGFGREDKGNS